MLTEVFNSSDDRITTLRNGYPNKPLYKQLPITSTNGTNIFAKNAQPIIKDVFDTALQDTMKQYKTNKITVVNVARSGLAMALYANKNKDIEVNNFIINSHRAEHNNSTKTVNNGCYGFINENEPIILCDPMLATGRSMIDAIENLIKKGAEPRHITIVSIIAAPDGIKAIREKFPNINIVVGCVDKELDVKNYIVPGLGDFGNNFFDCNAKKDFEEKIDKCLTMRPNADVGNNTILQMQKQCKDALMVRFKESAANTADIVRNSIPPQNRYRAKSRWDESFEMIKWNNFVQRTINKDNLEKAKEQMYEMAKEL